MYTVEQCSGFYQLSIFHQQLTPDVSLHLTHYRGDV